MGILIGYRPGGGVLGVLAASVLVISTAWALSWIFAFFGVIARTASSVQGISLLILFPLTFLSNIFVPVNTMPTWLQAFVNVNPVSYLVTAARDLSNTGSAGIEVVWALLGALVVVLIFAPLTVRAYMRRT
jgi:ABC-2 type transport system permease protein